MNRRSSHPGAPGPALSIVVPVYNGAGSVGELVAPWKHWRSPADMSIVLVNDWQP